MGGDLLILPLLETITLMKAVILAAGKGTRMKDLTSEVPKPMLKVQDKPILEHILEGLLAADIRDVFIVTGWHAEVIENYFGDGRRWGARTLRSGRSCLRTPLTPSAAFFC